MELGIENTANEEFWKHSIAVAFEHNRSHQSHTAIE